MMFRMKFMIQLRPSEESIKQVEYKLLDDIFDEVKNEMNVDVIG